MTSPVPIRELGHGGPGGFGSSAWDWFDELEQTPELQWPYSTRVYRRMLTDSQVQSVARAVVMPILRTTWRLDPRQSRPQVYEPLAEDLGLEVVGRKLPPRLRTKDRFDWQSHLELALDAPIYGYAVFEPVYRPPAQDPDGLARLRKLAPRWQSTITQFVTARDGGLVGVRQSGTERVIPTDRLLVYTHARRGYWHGQSLLRAAYKPWVLKDPANQVWFETLLRNGMGVPIYEPGDDETDLAAGEKFARGFRSGATAGGALPRGAKLTLLGVQGSTADPAPFMRYCDEQIARAVLAHVLNLGTQTGSWALGSVLADVLTQSLQAMADSIKTTANQHIVEDWVDLNFGPTEPAPAIVFDPIGSQQQVTAQAIKALIDAGAIFPDRATEEALRQIYNLPPKSASAPTDVDI